MKILKFGAVWCMNCIVMKRVWEEIEPLMPELDTEYIDIDNDRDKTKEFKIVDEIPVFVFLDKTGKEFNRIVGQKSKEELIKFIKENLNK